MEGYRKENTPGHFETEVANFIQIGLLQKYLNKKLGENYETNAKKTECEVEWIEKNRKIFRVIFDANKDEFLKMYKEDKVMLIDAIEEVLEEPL